MAFWVRRYEWMLPMVLAALAVVRVPGLSAVSLSALLCWVPGRLILRSTGIGRDWDRFARIVLAFALSIAATPFFLNFLWHNTNDAHGLLLPVCIGLTLLGLLVQWLCRENDTTSSPQFRLFATRNSRLAIAALTTLIAWFCIAPYWPREVNGAPVPSAIHDYIKHYAVLWSLQEYPLPLGNPFFADGAREPAYYYHFFYLIPATIRAVCDGPSIPLAFGLHGTFIAFTTAAMAAMSARRLFRSDSSALLAFALCTVVGGFDAIPILLLRSPAITLDSWADTLVRIHNLLTQMVWTPQNVQGLVILLLAAFVLTEKGYWRGWLLLGPMLGTALIGSTVWVAVAAFPALALLIAFDVIFGVRPGLAKLRLLCAAAFVGAMMIFLSSPIWTRYQDVARSHGKSLTFEWPERQQHALLGRFLPPGILANVADLPWVLLIEMGPLLILPLMLRRVAWRRAWGDTGMRLLILSAIVALVGFVTVRSHFTYNDFGQKIVMNLLVCGAILGAGILSSDETTGVPAGPPVSATRRWIIVGVLVLGLPVSLWQSPLAAIRRFVSPEGQLGRIALPLDPDDALAVQYLRDVSPPDAVVQAHWNGDRIDPRQPDRLTLQQMIGRQIGAMALEQDTHVFQGRDPSIQSQAVDEIAAVLAGDASTLECHTVLQRHGITHVFVGSIERAHWKNLNRFEDLDFFVCQFRHNNAAVYELR